MRTGKILGAVVGGLLALVAVALLAVRLFVNPNDYKPRITAAVRAATGRELELTGAIKLSVFPWIALELGPASLGNLPGFGEQSFVSFQHAAVRAKFLPLLMKRLEVGRLELDGLNVRLFRNAAGRGNWQGAAKTDAIPAADGGPAQPKSMSETLEGIAGIKITHARVSYQTYTLQNLTLETGAFAADRAVPISLQVEANRGVAGEQATLDVRFDLLADPSRDEVRIEALNLNTVTSRAGSEKTVRFSIGAPMLAVNAAARTLSIPAFTLNLAGAQVTGTLAGKRMLDAPEITGSVTLAPLVVREYLPRLGLANPKTRDPKALSLVSAATEFTYGGGALRLSKLAATVDDTHVTGSVAVVNLDSEAVTFELAVDRLDMDRYLAPPGTPVVPAPARKPAAEEAKAKPVDANGNLTVGSLHMAPLDLTQVKVTVATQDAVMRIHPLEADIDGGRYSGDVTLDPRSGTLALSLDEHLSGVDVGQLLAGTGKRVKLSGKGNVNLKATGRGADAEDITKTLTGTFDMNVANGAVEGTDLGYQLGRAEALIRRQDMPATPNTQRTAFDTFKMSAAISDGVASTRDLTIASAVFKVTGQGSVNLVAQSVDLSLLADTLRSAGNVPLQIPVKVTGAMADPTVRPDIEALAKGQLRQKVQDLVQDKLKGLFGK